MAIIRYSRKILQNVFRLQNSSRITKNSEKNSNSLIQSSLHKTIVKGYLKIARRHYIEKWKEYSISPLLHTLSSFAIFCCLVDFMPSCNIISTIYFFKSRIFWFIFPLFKQTWNHLACRRSARALRQASLLRALGGMTTGSGVVAAATGAAGATLPGAAAVGPTSEGPMVS